MRNLSEHIGFHDPNEMFDSIIINAAVYTNVSRFYIQNRYVCINSHADVIMPALSNVRICGNLNLQVHNHIEG